MPASISRALAQQIVDTISDVCGYNINFINPEGNIYASSNAERIGTFHAIGKRAAANGETIEVRSDDEFPGTQKGINIPIYHHKSVVAVVGISGDPSKVRRYAHLAERISNLLLHEQELSERHRSADEKKLYVIQSLQNGEFDNHDYFDECLQEFHIDSTENFRMASVEVNTRYNLVNISLLEQHVHTLFSSIRGTIYAYIYPNKFVCLLPESAFSQDEYRITRFAQEHHGIVQIAVGKSCVLSRCNASWESVQTAMDSIRQTQTDYVLFENLTLEILLGSIGSRQKKEFTAKVLRGLTKNDISFLKVYYEEEMSLQATAEHLFLHKNTVQQRLNRIMQKSSLNPRRFQEAVLLYLGMELDEGRH